jgi:alcohol dehydrogenase class IV
MTFEFRTAGRIVTGAGCSAALPEIAVEIGRRALLVHGQNARLRAGPAASLIEGMLRSGPGAVTFVISGEPDIPTVEHGSRLARAESCDMVVGIGGGSVLDAAKAIAGLAANDGTPLDYMEVVGSGQPLSLPALPVIAVPTTAGTGTEVTRNAVITDPATGVKASIRSFSLLPRVAVIDPLLTLDLPHALTASSGLDALTQLIEAFVTRRSQPLTDALCLEGLRLAGIGLRAACEHPQNVSAREAMSHAALMSGMALANAGLGTVHGIAAPLGGKFHIPHGAACAALLPSVTDVNIRVLQRQPGNSVLQRYQQIEQILERHDSVRLTGLVPTLWRLVADLGIPRLSTYGLALADIPELAAQSLKTSSTRGNPVEWSQQEMEDAIAGSL